MRKWFVYLIVACLAAFSFNGIAFSASQKTEQVQKLESKVNVNTASEKELATLPGIGQKTANRIVKYRQQFGPFETSQDLLEVKGIGKKTLKKIENLISFE